MDRKILSLDFYLYIYAIIFWISLNQSYTKRIIDIADTRRYFNNKNEKFYKDRMNKLLDSNSGSYIED